MTKGQAACITYQLYHLLAVTQDALLSLSFPICETEKTKISHRIVVRIKVCLKCANPCLATVNAP